LKNLEVLELYNNRVRDLSSLASLTNLKHLIIGLNPVERTLEGFSPLLHLNGLQIGSYAEYTYVVKNGVLVHSGTSIPVTEENRYR